MGVYIKGMRMPKGCYDPTVAPSYCFLLVSGICKICHKYADEHGVLSTGYPKGCPLIEVADRKTEPSNSEKPNNCEDEPQPRCPKCGERGYIRSLESMGVKLKVFDEYRWKCTNCNKYFKEEPKDEPTISKMEQVEDESQTCDNCKLKGSTKWCNNQVVCRAYKPKDEL